jgi:hypothetical protein
MKTCAACGGPLSDKRSTYCRGCYKTAAKGRALVRGPRLTVRTLTKPQREVFDLILARRRWNAESRDEALLMIEEAMARDALLEEVVFWTSPIPETRRFSSTMGLVMDSIITHGGL